MTYDTNREWRIVVFPPYALIVFMAMTLPAALILGFLWSANAGYILMMLTPIYYLNYERYRKWRPHFKYKVSNLADITQKVIPFFDKYPLQAKKKKSFELFSKVANLMLLKKHLNPEGILEIKNLKEQI